MRALIRCAPIVLVFAVAARGQERSNAPFPIPSATRGLSEDELLLLWECSAILVDRSNEEAEREYRAMLLGNTFRHRYCLPALLIERLESRDLMTTVITNEVRIHYTDTITDEQGTAIAIVVDLRSKPSHNVTIPVYSTNTAEGVTSVTSLTFTADTWTTTGNWANAQSIIVSGVDDAAPGIDDGTITYSVAFGWMVSGDSNFNGLSPGPAIVLNNRDDDVQANGCVMPPIMEDSGLQWIDPTVNDTNFGDATFFDITAPSVTLGQGVVGNPQWDNTVAFMPTANWNGNIEITYTIVNVWGDTSVGKSTLVVLPVPDKPVAIADVAWSTDESSALDVDDVVWNDIDVDNPPTSPSAGLTVATVPAPGAGALIINGGKGIRFTPYPGWNSERNAGAFNVSYKVKDAEGNVSDDWVTNPVTVYSINAPPEANGRDDDDDDEATEGEAFSFSTLDDAGEDDEYANQVLTYEVVNAPSHGTVAADGLGGWIYTPDPDELDYNGPDEFDYRVRDDDLAGPTEELDSDVMTVSINILAVNDQPIGFEQLDVSTDEDTPLDLTLAGEDGDPLMSEVQTLTFAIVSNPSNGSITSFNASTGQLTYEPAPNYHNQDDDYDWIGFSVTGRHWIAVASQL